MAGQPDIKPAVDETFIRDGAHWTVKAIDGNQVVGRLSHLQREPKDPSEIICLTVDEFFGCACRLQMSFFD